MARPISDLAITITVEFTTELHGDVGYLHERIVGGFSTMRYGPMPRDFLGPLIDERKEFFADYAKRFRWPSELT